MKRQKHAGWRFPFGGKTPAKNKAKKNRPKSLGLESLETRQMLSGLSTIDLQATTTRITGDQQQTLAASAVQTFQPAATLEAEAGRLTGAMTQKSDSHASGGTYVISTKANDGSVQFTVDLQQAGDYTILARVLAPTYTQDSFFVSVDGKAVDVFDAAEGTWSPNWQWSAVNGRGGTGTPLTENPRVFSLSAGRHTITFRAREAGTGLDQIQLIRSGGSVTNQAPVVNAGQDQAIVVSSAATLDGTVSDDGLPNAPGSVTTTWTKISGPGDVHFADASAADTTAQFSQVGSYVLRLTATDGELTTYDDVAITVNAQLPSGQGALEAEAGALTGSMVQKSDPNASGGAYVISNKTNHGSVQFTFDVQQAGDYTVLARVLAPTYTQDSFFVSVDGKPEDVFDAAEGTWSPNWQWTAVNGRAGTGTPLTESPRVFTLSAGQHTITFRAREAGTGLDQIKLVPSDGSSGGSNGGSDGGSDGGSPTNQAPVVSAGEDQSVVVTSPATLDGTVSDDGLPNSPGHVTTTWTKVSGPGSVSFGDASAVDTTAQFTQAGSYVVRLTATDGELTTYDDLTITVSTVPQSQGGFYVSPNGSANGDGSINNPWDLQTALSQPAAVKPGDTIWIRGGTYHGDFSSNLTGTADKPIIVRPYQGEHVQIDTYDGTNALNYFYVYGDYTQYRDLEIMSSSPVERFTEDLSSWPANVRRGGLFIYGDYDSFVNLVVHDVDTVGFWADGAGGEIYGSVIYNTGWVNTSRARGTGLYTQNSQGTKRIADNIIFNAFSEGIQAYGTSQASVDGYDIEGNTLFNAGAGAGVGYERGLEIVIGGGTAAKNVNFSNNYTYHSNFKGVADLSYLFGVTNENATVTNNYFATDVRFWKGWKDLTFTGNTIVNGSNQAALWTPTEGTQVWNNNQYISTASTPFNSAGTDQTWAQWRQSTGFDTNSQFTAAAPSGTKVFVRPNEYEAGRANVTVYNWDLKQQVAVDLSSTVKVGDRYEIRNVLDLYGTPVVSGVYDGKAVNIPMKAMLSPAATAYHRAPPITVSPEFGAFVVTTTGTSSNALQPAATAAASTPTSSSLTAATLAPIVDAAISQWKAQGLSPAQLAALQAVKFQVADLGGSLLGQAAGETVTLDRNAAGRGWFVDSTPTQNEEFGAVSRSGLKSSAGSQAAGHMDLLTTVMHELGHVLGYGHTDAQGDPDNLMSASLPTGIRRELDVRALDALFKDA